LDTGGADSIGERRAPARIDVQCRIDAALERLFAAAVRAPTIADERPTPEELIAYVDGTLAEMRRRSNRIECPALARDTAGDPTAAAAW